MTERRCRTLRRYVARLNYPAIAALVWLSVVASYNAVAAQVGHDPGQSPYRDVRRGGVLVATGGYLGGSRGSVGVGISDGPTGGLRYEVPLGVIGVSMGIAYAQTTSFVVDPTKDSLSRISGPYDNDVVLADLGLQLLLTGRKTWHGFAPYLGGALGLALSGGGPPDPNSYTFGNKVAFVPGAGLRWYPTRSVSVRTDLRLMLWKLSYPLDYRQPSSDGSRVLPLDASLTEWTAHPWVTIGLGWTF